MLDDNQITVALQKIANAFLANVRPIDSTTSGWGQFVGPSDSNQVGLYGTCAGVIAISSAYGPDSVPSSVVSYLSGLWTSRTQVGSPGAKYFSLTLRLSFYLLALRISRVPQLQSLITDVEAELLQRRAPDGQFYDWWINAGSHSATGKEYTTALVLLTYALSSQFGAPPAVVIKAAKSLQEKISGELNTDGTSRRLYLAAVVAVLPKSDVLGSVRKRVRAEFRRRDQAVAEYLYFWDYSYLSAQGIQFRRDYFYIPPDVVDVLLAANSASGLMQKVAAIERLRAFWVSLEQSPNGLIYNHGSSLAASKDQAWVTLAFGQASKLKHADNRLVRLAIKFRDGLAVSWIWNFWLPLALILIFGVAAAALDSVLDVLQAHDYLSPTPIWWDQYAKPGISGLGVTMLIIFGAPLATRLWQFSMSKRQ